jgi:hypothetical protein
VRHACILATGAGPPIPNASHFANICDLHSANPSLSLKMVARTRLTQRRTTGCEYCVVTNDWGSDLSYQETMPAVHVFEVEACALGVHCTHTYRYHSPT